MRIYTSEFAHDYSTYTFGYGINAEIETGDNPVDAYEQGFLPYSANPQVHNVFYMARSVRVDVRTYEPSSENRRVFRKFDGQFTARTVERDELLHDSAFHKLFLDYFDVRHGKKIMGEERLHGLLQSALPLRGIRYEKEDGTLVAAVFEPAKAHAVHFWFPAYAPEYIGASLGMWLMQDAVRRAQSEGRTHLYLGTAYGEKAKYKLNIPSLEYWDGMKWVADTHALKERMKSDTERAVSCGTPFILPS